MTRATDCSILARATAHLSEASIEHKFAPHRGPKGHLAHYRFDIAWPSRMVALEVEGGLFQRANGPGGHNRGRRMLTDILKRNLAAQLGWKTYYCTPEEVRNLSALRWVLPELEGVAP